MKKTAFLLIVVAVTLYIFKFQVKSNPADITAPVQLHVGGADEEVPTDFSQGLYYRLKSAGKNVEIYIYPGDNHNISNNLNAALQRSVEFFDKHLK